MHLCILFHKTPSRLRIVKFLIEYLQNCEMRICNIHSGGTFDYCRVILLTSLRKPVNMGSCVSTPHPNSQHFDFSIHSKNSSAVAVVVAQSLGPPQRRGERANGDEALPREEFRDRLRIGLATEDSTDLMISLLSNGPMTVGDAFPESAESCSAEADHDATKRANKTSSNKHNSEQQLDSTSTSQLNASVHSEQSGSRDASDPALAGRSTISWSTSTVQHQSKSIKGLRPSELDVDLEEI